MRHFCSFVLVFSCLLCLCGCQGLCDHHFETIVTLSATCDAPGEQTNRCTKCGYHYTAAIPMLSHIMVSTVTLEATCGTEGKITATCSLCGMVETEAIPKLSHNLVCTGEYIPAGCETDGEVYYQCTLCGERVTKILPPTGHTMLSGSSNFCTKCHDWV